MHQEAFPGEDISDRPPPEDERPGPAGADRGRPARPAATRPSRGGAPRDRAALRPAARPRGGRAAGRGCRDEVRLMVAAAGGTLRPHPLPRPPRPPARRRPAGRQRRPPRCPRRCPRAGQTARAVDLHLSTPDPDHRARWVVEVRARRRAAPARGPRRSTLPAGGSARAARALPEPEPPVDRAARPARAAARLPAPPRRADPLRPRAAPRGRWRTTRRSSPPSPAARRCRAPAGRSPSARSRALRERGDRRPAHHAAHRRQLARSAASGPYPERFAVSGHTAAPRQRGAAGA